MGKRKIHHPEAGGTGWLLARMDSLAEEGQLKAVLMSLLIGEIPRGIPPLSLEVAMRTMIPRELVVPPGLGTFPRLILRPFPSTKRERGDEC